MPKRTIMVQGERINLRQLLFSDAQDIFENVNDKEIAGRAWKIPYPYELHHAEAFIEYADRALREKRAYVLGIEFKETGRIIGIISFNDVDAANRKALLGYWIGKKYWSGGLMTEALALMLRFAFETLHLHRIESQPFEMNLGSRRVIEKNGLTYEGTDREVRLIDGAWINIVRYSVLEREYKARRKILRKTQV